MLIYSLYLNEGEKKGGDFVLIKLYEILLFLIMLK